MYVRNTVRTGDRKYKISSVIAFITIASYEVSKPFDGSMISAQAHSNRVSIETVFGNPNPLTHCAVQAVQ